MGNKINKILNQYDFTDSIIYKIETFNFLSKIVLEIDYYWGFMENKRETNIVLQFDRCNKIENRIPKNIIEMLEKGENIFSYYTVVKTEVENENRISFYNDFTEEAFLIIEFEEFKIYEKKNVLL